MEIVRRILRPNGEGLRIEDTQVFPGALALLQYLTTFPLFIPVGRTGARRQGPGPPTTVPGHRVLKPWPTQDKGSCLSARKDLADQYTIYGDRGVETRTVNPVPVSFEERKMNNNPRFSLMPVLRHTGTNRNDSPFWSPLYASKTDHYSTRVIFPGCPDSRTPVALCISMRDQLKRGNEEK